MFAKLFIPTFLGALYASGWWAWSIWGINGPISRWMLIPLVMAGLTFAVTLGYAALDDLD